jgi:hypothetical protein
MKGADKAIANYIAGHGDDLGSLTLVNFCELIGIKP